MEYQKIVNLLENTASRPSKFKTKGWIELNDNSRETFITNSQIKFKNSMPKWTLCNYSDAYILVKWTITVAGVGATTALTRTDRVR